MEPVLLGALILSIIISVLGFIMLLKYRNYGNEAIKEAEDKIKALNSSIEESEKMINELNNLTDYIISNIENKSSELKGLIEQSDRKFNELKEKTYSVIKTEAIQPPNLSKNAVILDLSTSATSIESNREEDIPADNVGIAYTKSSAVNAYKNSSAFSSVLEQNLEHEHKKIINETEKEQKTEQESNLFAYVVSPKAKDVLELTEQGMDSTEIAKRLGIGKGEIELILGLKK